MPKTYPIRDLNGRYTVVDIDLVIQEYLAQGGLVGGMNAQQLMVVHQYIKQQGLQWDSTRTQLLPLVPKVSDPDSKQK